MPGHLTDNPHQQINLSQGLVKQPVWPFAPMHVRFVSFWFDSKLIRDVACGFRVGRLQKAAWTVTVTNKWLGLLACRGLVNY
jgi:hypothetical protein